MNKDEEEIRLKGVVWDPVQKDEELATQRHATVLRFRLEMEGPHPGEAQSQDVEMRGRPRILGTVFEEDSVLVFGKLDSDRLLRASRINDTTTHATVRPVSSTERPKDAGPILANGTVRKVTSSVETHKKWWQGSKPTTHSILNVKLKVGDALDEYRIVEVRGVPDISGTVYVDDEHIQVFGEMDKDGVVKASRIEKPGGIVRPVRMHDPRSKFIRTTARVAGIVILIAAVFLVVALGLGVLGFWDFLLEI